jgi:hypothetical protein
MANMRNVKVPVMPLVLNYYVSNEFGIPAMRYEKLPSEGIDISCLDMQNDDDAYTVDVEELVGFVYQFHVDSASHTHHLAWTCLFKLFSDIFYEPIDATKVVKKSVSISTDSIDNDIDSGNLFTIGSFADFDWTAGQCHALQPDLATKCTCGGTSLSSHIKYAL